MSKNITKIHISEVLYSMIYLVLYIEHTIEQNNDLVDINLSQYIIDGCIFKIIFFILNMLINISKEHIDNVHSH